MTMRIMWVCTWPETLKDVAGTSLAACITRRPQEEKTKRTAMAVMLAVRAVTVKPCLCTLADTKAARHSGNPGMWGNVSALIIHLFWEGARQDRGRGVWVSERGGRQQKLNLRRSPQLSSAQLFGDKWLFAYARFPQTARFLLACFFRRNVWTGVPLVCSQLKKVRWLVWLTDRMVPVTVAEQSHGGEAREGGREGRRAQMEVTLQSGVLVLKRLCDVETLH